MLASAAEEPAAQPLDPAAGHGLFAGLRRAGGLLLAVSGGPDSIAMLHLAAAWQREGDGPPVAVTTVDHGLRAESRDEARFVAEVAAGLGLPHAVLEWVGAKPATRLMERGRDARYELMIAHAGQIGATHLVTAHTLDDQAETILFRLARGSGPSGLIGMRPAVQRGRIVHARPLLGVRKSRLIATCRANGWRYVEDPTNRDPRFARTRWRGLAALLEAEGLTPERLTRLAERLARQEAALDAVARQAEAEARREGGPANGRVYDAAVLLRQPEEIFCRILVFAIEAIATTSEEPVRIRLERLESFGTHLRQALLAGVAFHRTLAGALVSTRSAGLVRIAREPERRRGRIGERGGAPAGEA
jgi:tRNA(Ile)-lysidine synthase